MSARRQGVSSPCLVFILVFAAASRTAGAADETPLEALLRDVGTHRVDAGRTALETLRTAALDLRARLGSDAGSGGRPRPGNSTCLSRGDLASGMCAQHTAPLVETAWGYKAVSAARFIYDEAFNAGAVQLEALKHLHEMNWLGLDALDAPDVASDVCKSLPASSVRYPKKAACLPPGPQCANPTLRTVARVLEMERLALAFMKPFELAAHGASDVEQALTQGVVAFDKDTSFKLPKSSDRFRPTLWRYLHAKLLEYPQAYWVYVVDRATKSFIGYKRLRLSDTAAQTVVLTIGSEATGLRFYQTDTLGVPTSGAAYARDAAWNVTGSVWWRSLEAARDERSVWTQMYPFSPGGSADVGITFARRLSGSALSGAVGVDFYAGNMAHSFVQDISFDADSTFFVLNEHGQLVSSNKLGTAVDGAPVVVDALGDPAMRSVAQHIAATYPAVTAPEQHRVERRELANTRFFSHTAAGVDYVVGVKAVDSSLGAQTNSLRWTLIHMSLQSNVFAPLTRATGDAGKRCVTQASCAARTGGSLLRWRSSHVDMVSEKLEYAFAAADVCRRSVAIDHQVRGLFKGMPTDALLKYLVGKLQNYPSVGLIHVADLHERKIIGVQRHEDTDTFSYILCSEKENAKAGSCNKVSMFKMDASGARTQTILKSGAAVRWHWWSSAMSDIQPDRLWDYTLTPYVFSDMTGKSFPFRARRNTAVMVNVAVTQDTMNLLLRPKNPEGTVTYVMDTLHSVVATTEDLTWPDGVAPTPSTQEMSAVVRETARVLLNKEVGSRSLMDLRVRRAEASVGARSYDVDYRRVARSGAGGYFWTVVVARDKSAKAISGVNGVNVVGGDATCVQCMDSDVSVEARRQTLDTLSDAATELLVQAPRAILVTDAYIEAGLLGSATDEIIYTHLQKALVHETGLLWIGMLKKSADGTSKFYGQARGDKGEITKLPTALPAAPKYGFVSMAETLVRKVSYVSTQHLWSWSEWEDVFGLGECLTAVRPKGANGDLEWVLAAGVGKKTVQQRVIASVMAGQQDADDVVVVDHYGDVLFRSPHVSADAAAQIKTDFLAAHPQYKGIAPEPWLGANPQIDTVRGTTSVLSGLAFRHSSPAWEKWSPSVDEPSWVQWLMITKVDARNETLCIDLEGCRTQLHRVSAALSTRLVTHIADRIARAFRTIDTSVSLELSGPFKRYINDRTNLQLVRRWLAYHLACYPHVNAMYIQVGADTTTFMGILRKEILRKPNEDAPPQFGDSSYAFDESFDNFLTVECFDGACAMNEVRKDGEKGTAAGATYYARLPPYQDDLSKLDATLLVQHMKAQTKVFASKHSQVLDLTIASAGYSSAALTAMLRNVDIPAETYLFLSDAKAADSGIVASNRPSSHPVLVVAHAALKTFLTSHTVKPGALEATSFAHEGHRYLMTITYVAQSQTHLVAVRREDSGQGVVDMFAVGLQHDTYCAEQGLCQTEVDRLREESASAKAHFVELRTRKFLSKLDLATAGLDGAVRRAEADFPSAYDPAHPILAALADFMRTRADAVSAVRFDGVGGSVLLTADRDTLFKNSSGTYTISTGGADSAFSATKAEVDLERLGGKWGDLSISIPALARARSVTGSHHIPASGGLWTVDRDAMCVFRHSSAGMFVTFSGNHLVVSNCLAPFEGAVFTRNARGAHLLASNTKCQREAKQLQDQGQLSSVMYDTAVSKVGNCVVDMHPVWWRGHNLAVGMIERDVQADEYPAVAEDYACVTWQSCEVAIANAEYRLLDATVRHAYLEFLQAAAEMLNVSASAEESKEALLSRTHHMTFAVDAATYTGFYVDKMFNRRGEMTVGELRTVRCSDEHCLKLGVYRLGDVPSGGAAPLPLFEVTNVHLEEEGRIVYADKYLYVRRGGMIAAASQGSLTTSTGVTTTMCTLTFASVANVGREYRKARTGVLLHRDAADGTHVAYVRVSPDIVLLGSRGSSYVPVTPAAADRCVVDCGRDLGRLQGLGLAAALAAHGLDEEVSARLARLGLLRARIAAASAKGGGAFARISIDNPLAPTPDPHELLVYAGVGAGEASVGWFDGSAVLVATRAADSAVSYVSGHVTGSTSATERFVWNPAQGGRWVQDTGHPRSAQLPWVRDAAAAGEVWTALALPAGGHVAARVGHTALQGLLASDGFELAVVRDGQTIFSTAEADPSAQGHREAENPVSVPSLGDHSLWTVRVWTQGWVAATPPSAAGCFTVAQCQCEEEKLQARYAGLVREAHVSLHARATAQLDALGSVLTHERTGDGDGLEVAALVAGLSFGLRTEAALRRYTGVFREDEDEASADAAGVRPSRVTPFTCNETVCTERRTGRVLPELPPYPKLLKTLRLGSSGGSGSGSDDKVWFDLRGRFCLGRRVWRAKPNTDGDFVAFGRDPSLVGGGLARLLPEAPRGGEMFLLDTATLAVVADASGRAALTDPDAGEVTARCARAVLRAYEQGTQAAAPTCGYRGRAFSTVMLAVDSRLVYVGLAPRPSRPATVASPMVQAVLTTLAAAVRSSVAFEAMHYTSVVTGMVATAAAQGPPKSFAAAAADAVDHLRQRAADGYDLWFELRGGTAFTVFVRVAGAPGEAETVGFLGGDYAAGGAALQRTVARLAGGPGGAARARVDVLRDTSEGAGKVVASSYRVPDASLHGDLSLCNSQGIQRRTGAEGQTEAVGTQLLFPEVRKGVSVGPRGHHTLLNSRPLCVVLELPQGQAPAPSADACIGVDACEEAIAGNLRWELREAAFVVAERLNAELLKPLSATAALMALLPARLLPVEEAERALQEWLAGLLEKRAAAVTFAVVETRDTRAGVVRWGSGRGVADLGCASAAVGNPAVCTSYELRNRTAGDAVAFSTFPAPAGQGAGVDFSLLDDATEMLYLHDYGPAAPSAGTSLAFTVKLKVGGSTPVYATAGFDRAALDEAMARIFKDDLRDAGPGAGRLSTALLDSDYGVVLAGGDAAAAAAAAAALKKAKAFKAADATQRGGEGLFEVDGGAVSAKAYAFRPFLRLFAKPMFVVVVLPRPPAPVLNSSLNTTMDAEFYLTTLRPYFAALPGVSSIELSTSGADGKKETVSFYRTARGAEETQVWGTSERLVVTRPLETAEVRNVTADEKMRFGCFFTGFGGEGASPKRVDLLNRTVVGYGLAVSGPDGGLLDLCLSKTQDMLADELGAGSGLRPSPRLQATASLLLADLPAKSALYGGDAADAEAAVAEAAAHLTPARQTRVLRPADATYVTYDASFYPYAVAAVASGTAAIPAGEELATLAGEVRAATHRRRVEAAAAAAAGVVGRLLKDLQAPERGSLVRDSRYYEKGSPLEKAYALLESHAALAHVGVRRKEDGRFYGFVRVDGRVEYVGCARATSLLHCDAPRRYDVANFFAGNLAKAAAAVGGAWDPPVAVPPSNASALHELRNLNPKGGAYVRGGAVGLRRWALLSSGDSLEAGVALGSAGPEEAAADGSVAAARVSLVLALGGGGGVDQNAVVSATAGAAQRLRRLGGGKALALLRSGAATRYAMFDPDYNAAGGAHSRRGLVEGESGGVGTLRLSEEFMVSYAVVSGLAKVVAAEVTHLPVRRPRAVVFYLDLERTEFDSNVAVFLSELRHTAAVAGADVTLLVLFPVATPNVAGRTTRVDIEVCKVAGYAGNLQSAIDILKDAVLTPKWKQRVDPERAATPAPQPTTYQPVQGEESGSGGVGKLIVILVVICVLAAALYLLYARCLRDTKKYQPRAVPAQGVPQPGFEVCLAAPHPPARSHRTPGVPLQDLHNLVHMPNICPSDDEQDPGTII